jgi:site-specific recombinase XerD
MLEAMNTPLDHFFNERSDPGTLDILIRGPLNTQVMVYAQRLLDDGYAIQSGQLQLRLLAHFSGWLDANGIGPEHVDSSVVKRYVRSKAGKLRKGDTAALGRMLRMLRPDQVEAPSQTPAANQIVLFEFQCFLRRDRGLCEATITRVSPIVSAFLAERFPSGGPNFQQLSANDIAEFVQRQAQRISTKSAPTVVTALRSFLKYLFCRGTIDTNLAACVPVIATWALSDVPKYLPADQIQRVLDACERDSAGGRRDYAILLLLARLGLRAGEVVALTLDDIDWEAGTITVRGKGKSVAQMPLPLDAGAALADYIGRDRPLCSTRRVFIRKNAPLTGFANSIAISSLADRALTKAGVKSAYRGSHLFRPSLATEMLKQGASLAEIGGLLRHRRPDTTAIYAKVDLVSLRSIALPWPGGGR